MSRMTQITYQSLVETFFFFGWCCRCEIDATLDRLKKLERDLSSKEQELKERERRLKMWERKLIEQSNSPVSCSLALFHFVGNLGVKWPQQRLLSASEQITEPPHHSG